MSSSSSSSLPPFPPLPAQLQALEEEAWSTASKRELYGTPHIPGFPWFTATHTSGNREGEEVRPARRHVIPHEYTFKVFAKERWLGRRLLDVYATELAHHSRAYYEACLRAGRLRCVPKSEIQAEQRRQRWQQQQREDEGGSHADAEARTHKRTTDVSRRSLKRGLGEDAPPALLRSAPSLPHGAKAEEAAARATVEEERNVVLGNGDVVVHTIHRHEIPVAVGGSGVEPIYLLSVRIAMCGLLSVLKPTGVPTHATGRFQYNSLLAMVEYVLAPRRIEAWLWGEDPLMQALVSSRLLTKAEKEELYAYYKPSDAARCNGGDDHVDETVSLDKALRPCYRLDRVTSGVLLLGVSREATRRVSAALMHKSNAMDGAAARALGEHEEGTGTGTEIESGRSLSPTSSLYRLLTANYGLRKRYLAKVRGRFPSSSSISLPSSSPLQRALTDEAETTVQNLPESVMDSINGYSAASASAETTTPTCSPDFEGGRRLVPLPLHKTGILITTPIVHAKQSHDGREGGKTDDIRGEGEEGGGEQPAPSHTTTTTVAASKAGGPQQRGKAAAAAASSAVTVFQPLAIVADETTAGDCTVLQCIPFTGRLHQIRVHLSNWGFPILDDFTYGYPAPQHGDDPQESSAPQQQQQQQHEQQMQKQERGIYFDASVLPRAYLALYPIPACYTHGVPRDAGPSTAEPLCYECAGRLTIANLDETGAGQHISLHAWRYELDPSSLLPHEAAAQHGAGNVKRPITAPPTAFSFMQNGQVVFTAPLPDWAMA